MVGDSDGEAVEDTYLRVESLKKQSRIGEQN